MSDIAIVYLVYSFDDAIEECVHFKATRTRELAQRLIEQLQLDDVEHNKICDMVREFTREGDVPESTSIEELKHTSKSEEHFRTLLAQSVKEYQGRWRANLKKYLVNRGVSEHHAVHTADDLPFHRDRKYRIEKISVV